MPRVEKNENISTECAEYVDLSEVSGETDARCAISRVTRSKNFARGSASSRLSSPLRSAPGSARWIHRVGASSFRMKNAARAIRWCDRGFDDVERRVRID